MIVTFVGHADFRRPEELERKLLFLLEEAVGDRPCEMYLGDHGNFDRFAYACCKKYKDTHANVSLIFITPYQTPEYLKDRTSKYDAIVYPEIEGKPLRFAITYRNQWMIQRADLVICYVERDWGGAYKGYRYAQKRGAWILNLSDKTV